ncbi:T9SS type A sorting domain-containing protein [bacterium]|nr:T9SS type A sorting domain-containing protein [Balneola sp.]MBR9916282.1 T9SS type A sorting domain-containing protein [bacterium]
MKRMLLVLSFSLISFSATAQIDYSNDIQPIFTGKCNSCHSAGQNSFNSSSYSAVMASTSPSNRYDSKHVIPNNAQESPLVDKIDSDNPEFGVRMPQGGQLSTDEIDKIKQWINEGAHEEVQTSNETETDYPDKFELLGNYPNPFNPSTVVQFRSPVSSEFKITVYNANGQQVNSLIGRAVVGQNDFSVNLSDQPSGVYFYRIRSISNASSSLIGSGKMTLIK